MSKVLLLRQLSILFYADPGSGALLWQSLVGAFFGSMFYLRKFVVRSRNKRSS